MACSEFHLFEEIPIESDRVRGITTKAILTEDESKSLRWTSSTGNVSNPLSFDRPVQEIISTRTDDSVFVFTDKQGFVFPAGHKHPINEFDIQKADLDMAIQIKTYSHNVSNFIVAILWTDKIIIYAEENRFELKLASGLRDLTFVDSEYIYAWGNSDIYRIRIFEDGPEVFRHLRVYLPRDEKLGKSEEIKSLQAGRRFILLQTRSAIYSISNSTGDILAVRKTPRILEMRLSFMKRHIFSESVQMLVLVFHNKIEFVEVDSLGKALKVEWSLLCTDVSNHSTGSVSVVYENNGKTVWLTPLGPEEKIQKLVSRNELQKALAFARHYELDEEIIYKAELKNRIQDKSKASDPGHFQAVRFLSKKITDIEFFQELLKIVENKELRNAILQYIGILMDKEGVDEQITIPLMKFDEMSQQMAEIIKTQNFARLPTLLFPYQNLITSEYQAKLLDFIPPKIPSEDLISIIGSFQKIFEISDSGFCQNMLPKWSSERALNLEQEEPSKWPQNALKVLNALKKKDLMKMDFDFTGKENSYDVSIELLMNNLEALNELKVQYRIKITLNDYIDPTQRSDWLLEWIAREVQNRHDEISIRRIFNDTVKPLTFKWGFDFENFLLPFTDVSKNIPLQAKVSIMKLIPTASVRQQQLLNLLDQLRHPFPDYLVEFMKTMMPAGRA